MSLDQVVSLAGIVVPLASLGASLLNQYVRSAQEQGGSVAPWVLHTSAVLNAVALNGDKAVQAVKLAKGIK